VEFQNCTKKSRDLNFDDKVKLLVQMEGTGSVLAKDADGDILLHAAALIGHAKAVKLLLDLGGNVHAQTRYGRTPLHAAAAGGHEETVNGCCWT
jgi:ankyrin repeat protein